MLILNFLVLVITASNTTETTNNTITILETQHQAELTLATRVTYCDDTPSFSAATETTCTTLIAAGEECYSVCPSSTVVSTCSRVYVDFLGQEMFLGETDWEHSDNCTIETETRKIEIDGITVVADSIDDCEEQMENYITGSLENDLGSQCDTCTVGAEARCTVASRRRRETDGEFDVSLTITLESTTDDTETSDDNDTSDDYDVMDLSTDSFVAAVDAVFEDADEVVVLTESIIATSDKAEVTTEVYEVDMVSG